MKRSVRTEHRKKRLYDSPVRLVAVVVLAIIFAELTEEFSLCLRPDSGFVRHIVIDVFYMVLTLSPVLYWFVFKPLLMHIGNQERTEDALRVSQEQLRNLSSRAMVIQEQERKKIAMELHDDVGQAVNFIKLQLRSLRKKLAEGQVEARDDVDAVAEYLDWTIEKVRRLSRELSPGMLEDLGLSAALKGMFNDFRKHYGIEGTIDISNIIDQLVSHQDRIFIYRIFQEAMANISKHAMARTVSMNIHHNAENLFFRLKTTGRDLMSGKLLTGTSRNAGWGSLSCVSGRG